MGFANHTVFLLEDGTVRTVGNNSDGQCGTGNTTSSQLSLYTPPIEGVKQVSCGYNLTVFLLNDGTVRTVGRNNFGQLGTGVATTSSPYCLTSLQTPPIEGVKQVACGQYHTVFLLEDGTVRTVGYNSNGQCGTGSSGGNQLSLYAPPIEGVKQVSCGNYHTVFLLEDGTVRTVGNNSNGQCGTGNTTSPQLSLYTPLELIKISALMDTVERFYYFMYLYLIKQLESIKTFQEGSWVNTSLAEPLTQLNFEENGFENLFLVSQERWAELGNVFEVLMWTDDPNVTLNLSATVPEYKPFDVIGNPYDLDILTWTDGDELVLNATGDVDILAAVDSNNPEVLAWTNDGVISSGQVSGILDKPIYDYQVEINDSTTPDNPDKILIPWTGADGDISNTAIIPAGFVNKMNPYTVKVKVKEADGDVVESTGQILLYNTEPFIAGEFAGGWVTGLLGDSEDDKIQYNIYLNGTKIFPASTDFSDLLPSPVNLDFEIPSSNILFGQQNDILITVKDEFGLEGFLELNFIGDYFGLMFSDASGEYYSDNAGNILKYLDMGQIVAGQTTLPAKILLKNNTRYVVNNMRLFRDRKTLPENVDIEFSKTETPFIASDVLLFPDSLSKGSQVEFYVRVTSTNQAVGTGDFDIYVNSDIAQ